MITKRTLLWLSFLLSAAPLAAYAGDAPSVSFNGFGTIGLAHSDEPDADYVPTILVPEGVGHSDDVSATIDSRLGLQVSGTASDRLSGVLQVVVEEQHDNTFAPIVEWANVRFQSTPDSYVRVGRTVLPGVMASEYRKVGYALPWIRPPVEVYNLVPVTNSDGIDAGFDFRTGEFNHTLRINYGEIDIDLPDGTVSRVRDLWGVAASTERGHFAAHVSYLRADITVESFDPLLSGFRAFGPAGAAIADRYEFDDERIDFFGLGVRYDPGDWFLRAEAARLESSTIIGDRNGWYLTGGMRIGSVTPYATIARIQSDSERFDPGLPLIGLPAPVAARAAALNAGLNGVLGMVPAQKSLSLGLRWDFARNFSFKLQYDYLDLDEGSPGTLTNEQPGFTRGGNVSIVSAAVDFVF